MENNRITVIGSRDFKDYIFLESRLFLYFNENDVLISGGARGADKLAESFADKHGFSKEIFLPDWKRYGKSAGFRRNITIIESCNFVIAFWNGKSKGTKHSIDIAEKKGKPVKIYFFDRDHSLSKYIN